MNKATHRDKHGALYHKSGKWWYVWREDAWWPISGDPVVTLSRLP